MQLTNLKPENSKALVYLIGGLVAIVILAVYINKTFGGLGKMFSSIGVALHLIDSPEAAAVKQTVADAKATSASTASPWSPQFYKSAPSGARLLTQSAADQLAGQIWDSVGFWTGWNIDEVVAAFKQLTAKSQVSYLADRFNSLYNKDLLTWLTIQYTAPIGGIDPGLQTVINYVNQLPNY